MLKIVHVLDLIVLGYDSESQYDIHSGKDGTLDKRIFGDRDFWCNPPSCFVRFVSVFGKFHLVDVTPVSLPKGWYNPKSKKKRR